MKYFAWVAGWIGAVLLGLVTLTLIVTGILVDGGKNEPWGELAFVSLILTAVSGIAMGAWTDESKPVYMSRAQRKALKSRRAEMTLERAIKQLEEENLTS